MLLTRSLRKVYLRCGKGEKHSRPVPADILEAVELVCNGWYSCTDYCCFEGGEEDGEEKGRENSDQVETVEIFVVLDSFSVDFRWSILV
jgi:hypothetical protein